MVVIDGKGMIFGRAASRVAKTILNGEEVQLINAEQIIISGNPVSITGKLKKRRAVKHKGTPEHSPKWSKLPHLLVKRMIRGMLPWDSARGREAFHRLLVYTGNPKNLAAAESQKEPALKKGARYITIRDLCRMIGYSG
jgi:large subunit ribosomal protein L13